MFHINSFPWNIKILYKMHLFLQDALYSGFLINKTANSRQPDLDWVRLLVHNLMFPMQMTVLNKGGTDLNLVQIMVLAHLLRCVWTRMVRTPLRKRHILHTADTLSRENA